MLLVIGDLNARMGNDNTGRESNMGTHGCGIMNDNGQRLCELCEENKLVIGGTIFHHKENLDFTGWDHNQPDRPRSCQQEMEEFTAESKDKKRGRCGQQSQPNHWNSNPKAVEDQMRTGEGKTA